MRWLSDQSSEEDYLRRPLTAAQGQQQDTIVIGYGLKVWSADGIEDWLTRDPTAVSPGYSRIGTRVYTKVKISLSFLKLLVRPYRPTSGHPEIQMSG